MGWRNLSKVGIIGQRNLASSNEWNWILTTTASFTGKNFPASSNKHHEYEMPEQPGIQFIAACPINESSFSLSVKCKTRELDGLRTELYAVHLYRIL